MAATGEGEDADGEYVDGPLVETGVLEQRAYQTQLADAAATSHTLVCLPTGLGKTTVSLLVTAQRLNEAGGKALLLAPTKPLVQQHAEFYREALTIDDEAIVVFTGEVRPDNRAELWDEATIVIATPQVVENDILGSRIDLSPVTHCTFDECHRASGEYPYTFIAERYHAEAEEPLVTGMSASPGDDEEAILQVCANLGIREVEVMTEDDADVAAYTHQTSVDWERVELPEPVVEIRDGLHEVIKDRMSQLKELGVTGTTQPDVSEREIRKIQAKVQELMDADQSEGYQGMSLLAEIRKLRTAVTYAETQSVESLRRYFERLKNAARSSGASKADQRLVSEPKVREAVRKAEDFDDLHPKFRRTRVLIAQTLGIEDGERVIVFTESRDTAETLTDFLGEHFDTRKFVGQSDTEGSDGMSQSDQQETLDAFRAGEFEVLVSTSVAEEGLDVPEVDLVLFYEPVPTAIRSIQRKGRTGRQTEGAVTVLIAEDTRDEAYFWKSRQDEKRMEQELRGLKDVAGEIESRLDEQVNLTAFDSGEKSADSTATDDTHEGTGRKDDDTTASDGDDDSTATENDERTETDDDGQTGLDAFAPTEADAVESTADEDDDSDDDPEGTVATAKREEGCEVVIDQRELDSAIGRDLARQEGIETRLETLEVGDYVLSDRVVVERKSVADFLDTLTGGDRSVFEQVKDDARHYDRPVVILEGEGLYEERNVHPNAIRGALASLAVDFGASVLRTADEEGTAALLATIATREQETADREISVHGEKQSKTLAEQQEYVVASIADVGPVTAQALLEHFSTVEAVMTANEEDLLEVGGVGEVTAERIREVVGSDYDP
ncbi:DEAD/DEAH box helicase [Halorhabdus sp. CUG00001]|uniref:DEAD/DEAH box helicase n=1 Tax=Halorhabdus sp. CUG00001 TaxID=2600297 RepID=UPI00131CA294|nr:DEAD/DEAH box helicase [Halorhabdus sp. CUG00001]